MNPIVAYYTLMLMMIIYWLLDTGQLIIIIVNYSIMVYSVSFQLNIGYADGPFIFLTIGRLDIAFEWDDTLPTFEVVYESDETGTGQLI